MAKLNTRKRRLKKKADEKNESLLKEKTLVIKIKLIITNYYKNNINNDFLNRFQFKLHKIYKKYM